jgi:MFS family permease
MRSRNFRRWFFGQTISQIGFFVQVVAQALLVLDLTENGTLLGLSAALQFLPILVVGPWAGILSDRLDKRHILLGTQAAMMATALALGSLTLSGHATLVGVLLLAGLTGTAFAFDQPARRTIVTELVGEDDAANAISLNGAVGQAAKIVGPALGSVLVTALGVGWCFVVNGLTSIAVIGALLRMDPTAIRRAPAPAKGRGQICQGFRYVWSDASARRLLSILGVVAVAGFNWNVFLPLLVTRDLGADVSAFGIVMAVMSVGSFAGTLWLARRRSVHARLVARSSVSFGICLAALAATPTLLTACVTVVAVGASAMVLVNAGIVGLQLGAPPALRGRVMAVFSMVFLGSHALGGPLVGWIAERFGARIAIGCAAAAALTIGTATLVRSRRRTQRVAEPVIPAVLELP